MQSRLYPKRNFIRNIDSASWRILFSACVIFLWLISYPCFGLAEERFLINQNHVSYHTKYGYLDLVFLDHHIVHVTFRPNLNVTELWSPVILEKNWPSIPIHVANLDTQLQFQTKEIKVILDKLSAALVFYSLKGQKLLEETGREFHQAFALGQSILNVQQSFRADHHEAIYGLGQYQKGVMNYQGQRLELIQENTQDAVPFYVSSLGYGLLWDNPTYSIFNFNQYQDNQYHLWSEAGDGIDYYFIYGPKTDRVIAGYRELTGQVPMLPKWAFGYWQSKERYATQAELLQTAATFREQEIPIDLIILDWMYWGRYPWNAMQFDPEAFPNPKEMNETLHETYNLKFMCSVWPKFGESKPGWESPIYEEMEANGFLLPGGYGEFKHNRYYPLKFARYFDPFHEKARAIYWKHARENLFDLGLDAWWMDETEPIIHGPARFREMITSKGPGIFVQNLYSMMTTQAFYEGQRSITEKKRVCILTRSAFAGQQRYATVVWSGDIDGTWNDLKHQVSAGINFCMSGIPYWTHDIGGFRVADPGGNQNEAYRELFTRWFQFGAFCPIFRAHGSDTGREPWHFGQKHTPILIQYANLRYRLLPYIYSLAWQITDQGYTLMRGLLMDFPHDAKVYSISDQYMFGPAILVNPVLVEGATQRTVYLPETEGGWIDFWTGHSIGGGIKIITDAPVEKIPLYIRAGSIIPIGPFMQYATEKAADPLEIRIYPGTDGNFVLYEDENDNYNYEKGCYATIRFEWNQKRRLLTIGRRQGVFPGMLKERTFHICLMDHQATHGINRIERPNRIIRYNGKRIQISLK